MSTSEIRMYDALKTSLGEDDAKDFISAHNESVTTKFGVMIKDLATKDDLAGLINDFADLRNDFAALRNATKDDLQELRNATKADFYLMGEQFFKLKLEIKEELSKFKVEITHRIYTVTVIQTITIIGAVLAIIFQKR